MKSCTIVKFIESSNRFNMYITSFMSVCYWLFSHFTGKKPNFFTECRFGVISILIFYFSRKKKDSSIVPRIYFTVQQEFSHMVACFSFNMGKDNIFSIDSQHILH